jgi:DNA repair protein RadC
MIICDNCTTEAAIEDIGTTCRACGGRGIIYAADTTVLFEKRGRRYHRVAPKTVREIALEYNAVKVGKAIRSPQDTENFLRLKLSHLEHEVFAVIFLDNRHRILAYEQLFRGTIDGTSVYPREVIKAALLKNAAAIILAHNHPSGVAEPSQADERITKRIKAACELVDIRLLDHIVVSVRQCVSLASRGML